MGSFELRAMPQVEDYRKPYDPAVGFNDSWWHDQAERVSDAGFSGKEYLQFLAKGTEIGRAEIIDCSLSDSYVGINAPVRSKEICFFEIRQDTRRCGYGAAFAQHLVERYPMTPLIAFSEGADEFWSGIRWHYYPRKDGEEWPRYRNLYISEQIDSRYSHS